MLKLKQSMKAASNGAKACGFANKITYLQKPGEGRNKSVTLVEGIGIGPELTQSVRQVFKEAVVPIEFETFPALNMSDPEVRDSIDRTRVIMKCGIDNRKDKHYHENTIKVRGGLNLFADVVHAISFPNVPTRHEGIDIVIIRENTEGEYSGLEHEVYDGVIESIKIITKQKSLQIAEYAFEYAYLNDRRKVTAVHKANIMKLVDGCFLEACREVAQKYPMIKYEEMIIDNCCMQMTQNPWQFDVMLLPNLYGSIVSNIGTALAGGAGLTPGANIGSSHALFEQGTRHTAFDIAGQNKANPVGTLLSSVMMLRYMGLPRFGDMIEGAIFKTLQEGKVRTPDIGGMNTTTEFTDEICAHLKDY